MTCSLRVRIGVMLTAVIAAVTSTGLAAPPPGPGGAGSRAAAPAGVPATTPAAAPRTPPARADAASRRPASRAAAVTPSGAAAREAAPTETLRTPGLTAPVEIVTDRWGISHIYAETEYDLFFAQGYAAARDRLFQLEIWRRRATGTVAEVLGPREIERDASARLFRFRGDLGTELRQYHDRGDTIIPAFVDGINAWIDRTAREPDLLPLEFALLGLTPGHWTPEVVISRHQGLVGNVTQEIDIARAVAAIGADAVKELNYYIGDPDLTLDPAIDASRLTPAILDRYRAHRRPIVFEPDDIVDASARGDRAAFARLAAALPSEPDLAARADDAIGSNNWVVHGTRTLSGYPIMANDPHRAQSAPSLRYWVHLHAPGWNVIGGGEPALPGVSIGHNAHGAWGLTVFGQDNEDLYVYETDPADPLRYRYRGGWEEMTVIRETIPVKGQDDVVVDLKFTRHGPVVYEDPEAGAAYAVAAAWLDYGSAPYLASLRMDQATTWEEFVAACAYSRIPSENMVWADRAGTIGYQAVGVSPIRPRHSGLVPVPGDGRYDWDGFLPITALPSVVNPPKGYFGTANNYTLLDVPGRYPHWEALHYTWGDQMRAARVEEVLAAARHVTVVDTMRLQMDELSVAARNLVPLLDGVAGLEPRADRARRMLLAWDGVLDRDSAAAAIYVSWERALRDAVHRTVVPAAARDLIRGVNTKRLIDWLAAPDGRFGDDPIAARDALLRDTLSAALAGLDARFGTTDPADWRYGGERFKHALIHHPLSPAVTPELRARLDVGPLPRGGYGGTVHNTGSGDNQTSGASFMIIVDTADWDNAVGLNTPGQSGDPDNPHYRDLFDIWARDRYVPIFFSRAKVDSVTESVTVLEPAAAASSAP